MVAGGMHEDKYGRNAPYAVRARGLACCNIGLKFSYADSLVDVCLLKFDWN
jgi:hypothetical protein